jgi:hypothetical protein
MRDSVSKGIRRGCARRDPSVGAFDALDWLTNRHSGFFSDAMHELGVFRDTGKQLLDSAEAFDPGPSRKDRGEPQLRTELTRLAFFELIELVESVGIHVGSTSGKGGPGSRLFACLIAYAVGREVSIANVKALIIELRRRRAK